LTVPNPILKQVSEPVDSVTDETRSLMDDMLETMYDAPGIGLAAVQIGVPLNVIVMDLARDGEDPQPRYFVNPEILENVDDTQPYDEGCLSIPDVFDTVERAERVKITYLDYQGERVNAYPLSAGNNMSLNIVFMGTPEFAVPSLAELLSNGYNIVRVYTQPPRKSGRGQKVTKSPVHQFAELMGLDVKTPESFRKSSVIDELESLGADVACVVAYGQILPQRALDATEYKSCKWPKG